MTNKKIKKTKFKVEKLYASRGDLKGEVELVWNPVPNATSYVIQASRVNGKDVWKQVDIVTRSHCTVTGLRSSHIYKFRAAAVTGSMQNEWSGIAEEKAS
jgi:hypothetical protein